MPDPVAVAVVEPLDYGAMRLLRLRAVLIDFLRRWGIGLTIVVLLFAAGSNSPLTIAMGLASTLLVPLAWAARHGWWIVPATAAYAIAGVVPVAVSRSLWWPASWAAAERALPLVPAALRRSDGLVAAIVAVPLQGVLALGIAGLAVADGGHGVGRTVGVAWLIAAAVSIRGSVAWMTRIRARDGRRASGRPCVRTAVPRGPAGPIRAVDARFATIVLPFVRGRARRSAIVLVGGLFATVASATASVWSGMAPTWSLSIHALCALAITSVGSDATRRELQPLWLANTALPLPVAACERWRNGVVLLPTLLGVATSAATTIVTVPLVRVVPLAAYALGVVGGAIVEALSQRTSATDVRAARWLLTLVVCVACASEVT